jgi:hypothetical protein
MDSWRLSTGGDFDYHHSDQERDSVSARDLRLSAEYLSTQKFKKRHTRVTVQRNGELNFYRADIAVWRRSFR